MSKIIRSQADAAHDLSCCAAEARQWVETHGKDAKNEALPALRSLARRARRLASTALRPQSIAIYGASQAGKSYLTSSLSTPEDGPLTIAYGNRRMNFLGDINPAGGGESSGLVSRFTCTPPRAPSDTFSVPIRLLGPVDVINILANSYRSDMKLEDPPHPDWPVCRDALEALPRVEGANILTIDDVESVAEYLQARFRGEMPDPTYWAWLGETIGDLPLDSALKAFSVLWGQIDALTAYARPLISALLNLGRPEIAFCGVDALEPRSASILNVSTLFRAPDTAGPLQVVGENGRRATIARDVISAVIAELVVPMEAPRWPFMAETDLLDFPGARARLELDKVAKIAPECGQLFLRGKVDYLFTRYQTEMDITATLLCVADSAQEVQVLPRMIEGWINAAIGRTPKDRAAQDDALFLILTKFDKQFEYKAGADENSTENWDMRIGASITSFFQSPWVSEWKPGRPFDNVYWLRAATVGDLYERDDDRREERMRDDVAKRIARGRASYLQSAPVKRHVRNRERAFDEAMTANDGGISYLASQLRGICDAQAKNRQIAVQLFECQAGLSELLRPFYHDPDATAADQAATAEGLAMVAALKPVFERRKFGSLLLALGLEREATVSLWRSRERDLAPPHDSLDPEEDIFAELGVPSEPTQDEYDRFAAEIISYWRKERLIALSTDRRAIAAYGIAQGAFEGLAERIEEIARDCNLEQDIAQSLRDRCSHGGRIARSGEKQAVICVELVGRFLATLGYAGDDAATRPARPKGGEPIFTAPPAPDEYPILPERAGQSLRRFNVDWLVALKTRIEAGGPRFDVDANARLGALFDRIAALPS